MRAFAAGWRTWPPEGLASGTHGAQDLAVALDINQQPRAIQDGRPLGDHQLRQDLDCDSLSRVVVQMLAVIVRVNGLGLDVKAVERHQP